MHKIFISIIIFFCLPQFSVIASELPVITHYKLETDLNLKGKIINARATITIKNITNKAHDKIPFLLYRLLSVENVFYLSGKELLFNQNVVQLPDLPSVQAREVIVNLANPLQPNDSTILIIIYSGMIYGYPEVMAYVRDKIDINYSLLRPDSFSYPLLSDATFAGSLSANDTKFTYLISATVPLGYSVACGGELVNSNIQGDYSTFIFKSKVPTWRIDIAVAKFNILENNSDKLFVYHLPEDSIGAKWVINAAKNVIRFYSQLFGLPNNYNGYTIIQIPDGWGSQAAEYYFLQTSASFKDSSRISEVYHEIGHTWNATPSNNIQRCRFFDEAFASFFESLAIGYFNGNSAMEEDMEKSRDLFIRWAQYDSQVFSTPIAGYGAKELGRHSYTKGAWSLYILYRLFGEESFSIIIKTMLSEYTDRTIDFHQFQKLCERVTKRDLNKFFNEWIFGIESSHLLVNKIPVSEIVIRYK